MNHTAPNFQDLTGKPFGRFIVLRRDFTRDRVYWICKCSCGNEKSVNASSLVRRLSKSCGCLQAEVRSSANTTHGAWKGGKETITHRCWRLMMARCYRKENNRYASYGARGLQVCRRWHRYENFLADMGQKPVGLTIERKRNNEGYSKSNCRWATNKEQANNRRSNRLLTFDRITRTQAQWAELLGISSSTIHARLSMGWSVKDALTRPLGKQSPQYIQSE